MNWYIVFLSWLVFNATVASILLGGAHLQARRYARFYRLAVKS